MRYGIISDLHSNKQALTAVLADIKANGVDEIVCLGDVVGYGPSPVEVLDLARKNASHFVLGNHDAVVAGKMSPENFNDNARFFIDWTCEALENSGAAEFFNTVPLILKADDLRLSHGEFEDPGRFGYIIDDQEAIASFNCCEEALLFIGHSHVPGLYVVGNSGVPHWLSPQNFKLEEEKRYIVNVGSVGQPRDDDVCASYCIYDVAKKDVLFRKVPFDLSLFRDDLARNSLPQTAYFLTLDQSTAAVPTKDLLEFTPLSAETAVKMEHEVRDLQQTVADLKKSKRRLLCLLILMAMVFAIFGSLYFSGVFGGDKANNLYRINSLLNTIGPELRGLAEEKELLSMPEKAQKVTKEFPLDKWSVKLTNPELQKVEVIKDEESKVYVFVIRSSEPSVIEISSLKVPAQKGMRFCASASFKNIRFDSGLVELLLEQELEDGSRKTILLKEPKNLAEAKKWVFTSLTQEKNAPLTRDGNIIMTIRTRISGEVQIRNCSMFRK